jgi:heptosyltransferase-2
MRKCLVIQTAFIGDAILTLPVFQVLKRVEPSTSVDALVIPRTAELFRTHPAVTRVITFDKRGEDQGLRGLRNIVGEIRQQRYDAAIIPHRSIRSAMIALLGGIPMRIGFDRSAGWLLLNERVSYDSRLHEIERNLSLLAPLGIPFNGKESPKLYPTSSDAQVIDEFLSSHGFQSRDRFIGVAPGSVWKTKRWLEESFVETIRRFVRDQHNVVLIGGKEDEELCSRIRDQVGSSQVAVAAGTLSLLQSAELIRRCAVLLTNDSAPMHLAVAMGTSVIALYGATVPEFGFAPYGNHSVVLETKGLACRPCSIHGGNRCPIETFDCMRRISTDSVVKSVKEMLV